MAAGVGVSSGYYLFAAPLKAYWEAEAEREAERRRGDGPGGGGGDEGRRRRRDAAVGGEEDG
jgi:hypothetical protein